MLHLVSRFLRRHRDGPSILQTVNTVNLARAARTSEREPQSQGRRPPPPPAETPASSQVFSLPNNFFCVTSEARARFSSSHLLILFSDGDARENQCDRVSPRREPARSKPSSLLVFICRNSRDGLKSSNIHFPGRDVIDAAVVTQRPPD